MTTLELLKEYLRLYFTAHTPERIFDLLSEDIRCYGFADGVEINGMDEARALLAKVQYLQFMDYGLALKREEQIAEESAMVVYSLTHRGVTVQYRLIGHSRVTQGVRRLFLLNFCMVNPMQTMTMFDDLRRANREAQARELLMTAMPGGVMGGYMTAGFPLYFINEAMLSYLGYADEADYRQDVDGLVANSFHPEDAAETTRSVNDQLAENGSYIVDYRMRRKDGSYIWVHDVGKQSKDENGRDVIISACCDVTKEKEHERFLDGLVANLNGDLETLAVDLVHHRTYPVFVSGDMGAKQGLSREDYLAKYAHDGMDSIYAGDRERVWQAICSAVEQDASPSISFRIITEDGKSRWMNASFSRHGEKDGMPMILVLFTESTVQNQLQLHALSRNGVGIAIIDAASHEIYYANDALFSLMGLPAMDYSGQVCPEVLRGCGASCAGCQLEAAATCESMDKTVAFGDRWLSTHVERGEWQGKQVVNIFLRDVTVQHTLREKAEGSTRELQQLLANMSCGFCVGKVDADGALNIRYLSEGFCRMFEGTQDELAAIFSREPCFGVAEEDRADTAAFIGQCTKDPCQREITYHAHSLKGREMWIMLKVNVIAGEQGALVSYATYFDVTEQMRIRRQINDMLRNVPGGVCMYTWQDGTLTPLYVSNQVARLFGCGEDSASLMKITTDPARIHPDDLPMFRQCVRELRTQHEARRDMTYRVCGPSSGQYRWVNAAVVTQAQPDGSILAYVSFTDVNDLKELSSRLRQEEAILQAACESASVWTWVYDIPGDCIHASQRLREDFDLPEYMADYSKDWPKLHYVCDQSMALYRQKVQALRDGADMVEFEARVGNAAGVEHWYRIRAKRFAGDQDAAICTGQIIDDEIVLRARVELEKQKLLSGDQTVLGYLVVDVTQDRVLEVENVSRDMHMVRAGVSIDQAIEETLAHIAEKDRDAYRALHERQALLENYRQGRMTLEFEGHRINDEGLRLWVRSVMKLMKDPTTDSICLYEYIYDTHTHKMLEEITTAAARNDYRRVASVDMNTDRMTVICLNEADHSDQLVIWPYTEHAMAYGQDIVVPEERAEFCSRVSLERVRSELKDRDSYEFIHHVIEQDGSIGCRRTRYSIDNRDLGICLMTRADVTEVMEEEEQRTRLLSAALRQAREALDEKEALEQDRQLLNAALFNLVPMVISANLTRNCYVMLNYDKYTTKAAPISGTYDELVAAGIPTIPEDQQAAFEQTFCMENMRRAYQRGDTSVVLEHQQMGDDGILRWIETRAIFVKNERTGDLHTVTLAQDVTERKQSRIDLEKALETAENATQAKSEFLSRMSHEIRTPMNAIMGMTAIAKENRADFAQVGECLDKIDMSSRFLLTLINDILEMSRIESGRTEIRHTEFDFGFLIDSIRTVVEPLALKSSIRYDFVNNAQTDSHYVGDAIRIQQVLVNILTNAVKFTKPGGRVRFSVQIDSVTETKTHFRFVVADTGIGMSDEFMARMFTPFTQEDGSNTSVFGGSGLGLAISKSLTEAMGGHITVESFQGVGSTFTVTLPVDRMFANVQEAPLESPAAKRKADLSILKGRKVLMAEDHPLNVLVARKILEQKGVAVTVAGNGREAVDMFRTSQEDAYDAILMDIRMPVMDGWDATRAIRRLDRADAQTVPIIAMTANALDEDRRHSAEAGMNAHLSKPFEPAQLYTVLAEQIAKAEGEQHP